MKSTESNKQKTSLNEEKTIKSTGNKFLHFLLKHIRTVILILLVLGIYFWAKIEINRLNKNLETQITEITNLYESKIDSLSITQMELTAKTFSWAIRSEMQRENKEQVGQFFNEFVKQPQIIKLQYINAENSIIEISTNKKEEGVILNSALAKTNVQLIQQDSLSFKIATPIMGLNKKLGTVIIDAIK